MDREVLEACEYERERKGKWLVIMAFLPGILVLCFILVFFKAISSKYSILTDSEWMMLLIIGLLYFVCHFISAIVFIWHVVRCMSFNFGKKIMWIILLLLFSAIICPVYYSEYAYQKNFHLTEKELKVEKKRLLIWALLPGIVVLFTVNAFFYGADAIRVNASDARLIIEFGILGILLLPFFHLVSAVRYIALVSENKDMNTGKKVFWGVLFFLFSVIACPIYWYVNVNKKKKSEK